MRGIDRVLVLAALCLTAFGCGDRGPERPQQHPRPTATATPAVLSCPTKLTYTTLAGSDLDVGSSGIYFDQQTGEGGSLSFALACPGAFPACGDCALSGPIQSTTPIDNHRCDNATETRCTSNADCSEGGACAFFFGAPLPISGGGVPVCVTTRVNGAVTGTVNPADGSGASNLDTVLSIHISQTVDQPCPTCSGAAVGTTGTCNGGPRAGQACVVHGLSPVFGATSFDCPPNASADIGDLDGPLNLTTGTRTLEATTNCTGAFQTEPCYCPGQRMPNNCDDQICTVDASGEGVCEGGPVDPLCTRQPFRGCGSNADCPLPGDECTLHVNRMCAGATDSTGRIDAPLSRTGTAGRATQVQVAAFCLAATRSVAVNLAAGLPGPVTMRLPTSACVGDVCP